MTAVHKDPIFRSNGTPRYGYCSHGEANGFCDRGGCDEFWVYKKEEEQRRYADDVYTATQKQIGFMRSLVAKKELTDQNIIDLVGRLEALLAAGRGVNGYRVSSVIGHAKTCADKVRAPKVNVSVANVEPASVKQIGFMSSLLKRKDVPAELLAQVEEAKADKRKASKVIDALTKCADKVAVSV